MDYRNYLLSAKWLARRERRLKLAGYRCEYQVDMWPDPPDKTWSERCKTTGGLEVHHLHYDTLGSEEDGDLEVLCRFHHLLSHLLAKECATSGEPVFDYEQGAITVIEAAAKRLGGVDKVTPGDLCAPAYSPSVRHYLEKDN